MTDGTLRNVDDRLSSRVTDDRVSRLATAFDFTLRRVHVERRSSRAWQTAAMVGAMFASPGTDKVRRS